MGVTSWQAWGRTGDTADGDERGESNVTRAHSSRVSTYGGP
ncbi:hypothetical protein OB919_14535 [Halobacteria archaeon AArc-curdl1]|uniref:Uncharacterized protein n=1 Tax=Natronosalvus hydrolyticus TaxID=2979988 RepID=A0AAP2Z9H0_9EURY|nr:hypothetical protein [Halobacteria archaeon AArc-curdl1]